MPPRIMFLDDELVSRNLSAPELAVLAPDNHPYHVLAYQPEGEIRFDKHGIGNVVPSLDTERKFQSFLQMATGVDLAITPEYSCPWDVLLTSLENGVVPRQGGLWVLGCESTTPQDLSSMKQRFQATWIYEDVSQRAGNFLNPVCYIFGVRGEATPVVVVQFKTVPSEAEQPNLICGGVRYVLRNNADSIGLFSLICSDSLEFDMSQVDTRYRLHPYLVLHLQMTSEPRHEAAAAYRQACYLNDASRCEFISLNWSNYTIAGLNTACGGSAVYTKRTNPADADINRNHPRGLYYTYWHAARAHAYYFNHSELVFALRMSKSDQIGPAAAQNRYSPEVTEVYRWDDTGHAWVAGARPDDGFSLGCNLCGCEPDAIIPAGLSPLDIDRLFSLSMAAIDSGDHGKWYEPCRLPILQVDNTQVVRRISCFPCVASLTPERQFYVGNMNELRNQIITNPDLFPEHIRDLSGQCDIGYDSSNGRHGFNLFDADNPSVCATVAYLGNHDPGMARSVRDTLAGRLGDGRWRRLVVWYKHQNDICWVPGPAKPQIDDDPYADFQSIAKESIG